MSNYAPVAQWIEQWFPEPCFAGVRVPSGVFTKIFYNVLVKNMRLRHRYSKNIFRIIAVLSFVCIIMLSMLPGSLDIAKKNTVESTETDKDKVTDNDKILTDPAVIFNYAGTDYLERDKHDEINKLVTEYYNATLSVDMDRISDLVSDISQVDQNKLITQASYMENIDNIICYTIDGPVEGTFRAYVYYDMKLYGINTPAPALSALYITMASDGRYIIYLSGLDNDTQNFISSTDTSEDVVHLKKIVNDRFENVVNTDEQLKAFCEMINSGTVPDTAPTDAPGTSDVSGQAISTMPAQEDVSAGALTTDVQ